jgi:acyl-homoserine-lactone acylase
MVFADHDNIGWQVTGRFPLRKKGRGLMPSPGWTGQYDWVGYLAVAEHPNVFNPPEKFIATANNRKVPAEFPHTLSSSWFYPERGERIEQMIQATEQHSLKTSANMQLDTHSLFVPQLKDAILKGELYEAVKNEIKEWNDEGKKARATEALTMLDRLSGDMHAESQDACIVGALLYTYTRNTFSDELGSKNGSAWVSFLENSNMSYSAQVDHLIVRGDESPFWDDVNTPQKEAKAQIIARSLADAINLLEEHLGGDRSDWQWGNLHTYTWATEATKLAKHLDFFERTGMRFLASYFNRGPFPAGGDHTTPNVAAYPIAKDFDVWLIPEMRIVVDFGLEEPMIGINSTGQSDNPVGPHYDDGIYAWLEGRYQAFPFRQVNIERQYNRVLVLHPAGS